MHRLQGLLICAVALTAVASMAAPAAAVRPSCSELLAIRASGASNEHVVQAYGTTRARLAACDRLAEQGERLAARRAQFFRQRDQRGLDR